MNENVNVDLRKQSELDDILSQVQDTAKFGYFELHYVELSSYVLIDKLVSIGYNCRIDKEKSNGLYSVMISWRDVGVYANTPLYSAEDAYNDANNTLGIILHYIRHKALSGNVSIDFRFQMNICTDDIETNIPELRLRGFTIVENDNHIIVSWKTLPLRVMNRDFTARHAKKLAILAQYFSLKDYCEGKQLSVAPFIPYENIYQEVFDKLKENGYDINVFLKN